MSMSLFITPQAPRTKGDSIFTRRDRIAIVCISVLILAGWGVRLLLLPQTPGEVRVIRGAVKIPAELSGVDSARSAYDHSGKTGESLLVDINTADSALLETLPMIGPVKAADIIRYREQHGRFLKSSDIMKVTGIGPGTFKKIEKRITAGNP
jgi:competence ComEA-like helix-hairpin-helix protein